MRPTSMANPYGSAILFCVFTRWDVYSIRQALANTCLTAENLFHDPLSGTNKARSDRNKRRVETGTNDATRFVRIGLYSCFTPHFEAIFLETANFVFEWPSSLNPFQSSIYADVWLLQPTVVWAPLFLVYIRFGGGAQLKPFSHFPSFRGYCSAQDKTVTETDLYYFTYTLTLWASIPHASHQKFTLSLQLSIHISC